MFRPGRVRMYVHDKGRKPGEIERHDASFGTRLRRLREAAGLTQEELAERAGLSAKGISDLERGERRRPYPHTVRSLADALKLSGDERASLLASVPRRSATAPAPSKMARGSVLPIAPTSLVGREQDLVHDQDTFWAMDREAL